MELSFRAKPMRLQRGRFITYKNEEFLEEFYGKIKLFVVKFFVKLYPFAFQSNSDVKTALPFQNNFINKFNKF